MSTIPRFSEKSIPSLSFQQKSKLFEDLQTFSILMTHCAILQDVNGIRVDIPHEGTKPEDVFEIKHIISLLSR